MQGAASFESKHYNASVAQFAAGLDSIALAAKSDSCGLKSVAAAIGKLSARLAAAVAKVEKGRGVKIVVGSADIYDELYSAAVDLKTGDYAGVGMELGMLLRQLKASTCETKACIVMEGILASLQVGFVDLTACSADVDQAWSQILALTEALELKEWKQAFAHLGALLDELGESVSACGIPKIGSILSKTAAELHDDALVTFIDRSVQMLVSGADVTPDIQKIIVDFQTNQWASLGKDLGSLSDLISGHGCKSFVCRLIEGVLQEAKLTLTDLEPCTNDLRLAENKFTAGAAIWRQGQPGNAVRYWAAGLNEVAQSVDACGLTQQLSYIKQEANVLGLGNVTMLDGAARVLVHGKDFYEALYHAVLDIEHHDYRSAGSKMAAVMNQLSQWSVGHVCTSDACYVVNGVLQYFGDLQNDEKACKSDFKNMWGNFTTAYSELSHMHDGLFSFSYNKTLVTMGIHDIGHAFSALSDSVSACHLEGLANILDKLANQLGLEPEIGWVEELIHIVINGVSIEQEVADACGDFTGENWPAFGYNLAKLAKTLLTSDRQAAIIV